MCRYLSDSSKTGALVLLKKKRFVFLKLACGIVYNECCIKEVVFQVPGFRTFIIEVFATNCCLYSVLDKSFDFRDANSVSQQ